MKKLFIACAALLSATFAQASGFDLTQLFGKSTGQDTTQTGSKSGGILDALSGIAGNLTATDKFSVEDRKSTRLNSSHWS